MVVYVFNTEHSYIPTFYSHIKKHSIHTDIDHSVYVLLSRELFLFYYVLYSVSYFWSCDLANRLQAIQNLKKNRIKMNKNVKTFLSR